MAGFGNAGPLGSDTNLPTIDEGTLARTRTAAPASVAAPATSTPGGQVANGLDPDIEALLLSPRARKAAYILKKAHPSVVFTSGRRDPQQQAAAMASNVVKNRKWIAQTYAPSAVSRKCQEWVDKNPDKTTKDDIANGLASIFRAATDSELRLLSKHLSGDAFDVQPVAENATRIKKTIRGLPGLDLFLDKEGGLVRWHAQF